MTFFCASLALGNALKLLCPATELVVTSCHVKSTFCHSSQSDQEMIHCCIEWEKTTQDNDFFFLYLFSSRGTHLLSFFTFPIFFKCQMTLEWLTLSSLATCLVVVRGSASMIALNWSLSISSGQPIRSSSSRLLSPLQNFLKHHCTVH